MAIIEKNVVSESVKESAEAKAFLGSLILGVKNFVQDASDDDALHKVPYYEKMGYTKEVFIGQTLKELMPVARHWAIDRINAGEDYGKFEDEIFEIDSIEAKLYAKMKDTFLKHVAIRGYDNNVRIFVNELKAIEDYDCNKYKQVLERMLKAENGGKSRSFEYLIRKTSEYVQKVNNIGRIALKMLKEGKKESFIGKILNELMPVARHWAIDRINAGGNYVEFEDEIFEIDNIEAKLYDKMKETFLKHVEIRGYDNKDRVFVCEIEAIEDYDHNKYNQVLARMRKAYVKDKTRSLEYLISKTTEYVRKVSDVGRVAFEMLKEGKQLDFEKWSAEQALQDAVFEENKQFLKQTLKHLESMKRNKVKLGVSEIRLLLNQKDGCRREKLYHQAEEVIISIYNSLPCTTSEEKNAQAQIYKEICSFVYDVVPLTGRISVNMINFIFDRGFLSSMSRSLLLKIQPRINSLSMTPLFHYPLQRMLKNVYADYMDGNFTASDYFVVQVALAYEPKLVCDELKKAFDGYVPCNDFAM